MVLMAFLSPSKWNVYSIIHHMINLYSHHHLTATSPAPPHNSLARWCAAVLVAQSCPTLCDPVDCSLPSSSVHGDSLENPRTLEWVAMAFSRGPSQAWEQTQVSRFAGGFVIVWITRENPMDGGAWKAAVHGVAEGRTQLSDFTFTFHSHALGKEMAAHSSVLAWRIPGTGEPGGLPSMGSHRVGHDWSDLAAAAAEPPGKRQDA